MRILQLAFIFVFLVRKGDDGLEILPSMRRVLTFVDLRCVHNELLLFNIFEVFQNHGLVKLLKEDVE